MNKDEEQIREGKSCAQKLALTDLRKFHLFFLSLAPAVAAADDDVRLQFSIQAQREMGKGRQSSEGNE